VDGQKAGADGVTVCPTVKYSTVPAAEYVPVYRWRKVDVDPSGWGYNPGGAATWPSHDVNELLDV